MTTIGELIEAKTEVANIVVDVLSGECFVRCFLNIQKVLRCFLNIQKVLCYFLNIQKVLRCCCVGFVFSPMFAQLWTRRPALLRRRRMNVLDFVPQSGFADKQSNASNKQTSQHYKLTNK